MARREIQRVIKIGRALGVCIPQEIVRTLKLQRGDLIALSCTDENTIVIRRLDERQLREMSVGKIEYV